MKGTTVPFIILTNLYIKEIQNERSTIPNLLQKIPIQ